MAARPSKYSIPGMVEVYKTTIEQTLQVEDILWTLKPELGTAACDAVKAESRTSNRNAVRLLLKKIEGTGADGAWRSFINALDRAGYRFLVTLLQGEEENNRAAARGLLDIVGPELLNKLDVRGCVDVLYEKDIISEGDKEEIEAKEKQQGPIAATRLLLDRLPRRNQKWTDEFSLILKQHGLNQIARMFSDVGTLSSSDDEDTPLKEIHEHVSPSSSQPVQVPIPGNEGQRTQSGSSKRNEPARDDASLLKAIDGLKSTTEGLAECLKTTNELLVKLLLKQEETKLKQTG